jgi:hypothetical protein
MYDYLTLGSLAVDDMVVRNIDEVITSGIRATMARFLGEFLSLDNTHLVSAYSTTYLKIVFTTDALLNLQGGRRKP